MSTDIEFYAESKAPEGEWEKLAEVESGYKSRELMWIVDHTEHRYAVDGIFDMPTLYDRSGGVPDDTSWPDFPYWQTLRDDPSDVGWIYGAYTLPTEVLLFYPWEQLKEIPKNHYTAYETMPAGWWAFLQHIAAAEAAGREVRVIVAVVA